jgi:intracellular multiplication protein IcmO
MRGVDASNEIDPNKLLRDTRTLGQRFVDFAKQPVNVAVMMFSFTGVAFIIPATSSLIFIIGLIAFIYSCNSEQKLPFRMPKFANVKDYNDLKPGIKKPNMARGITYFGNDIKSGKELWFANEDMRTHVLIFGSTGAGKTETLVSLAFNSLAQGSGFIYVDGKGDNALYAKIFSIVRSMGRDDDLLLINFMTGARDIIGPQEKRLSNTLNPFCQGSSSMLTQLVVGLMGDSQGGGDGDMWKGRAIAFTEALMRLLVYMRDAGHILLDANVIRNYFDLPRLESIIIDKIFPRDDQDPVNIENVPKLVTDPLNGYIKTLPGYNKEKKGKQVSQVLEQHGFITMQLVRSFTSLADTYGHILRTNLAEVDFKDVVLNRRILVVLLPALEKSPDELSTLGKIIVSSLKAMMAAGLGEDVEGDYRDVIERKPTNAPTPYVCILDEYGYYAVKGFAVVPAQARSLGFSVIFAGQDMPAFQKASKEEAASIGANTNIKICMKLEDPTETWEFFTKSAGEAYVTKVDSFQTKDGSMTNSYMDTKSSSFEKRARVDLLDLKDQTEGEAHIFFRSQIVRARMFYASPKPVKRLKINQFLKVDRPADSFLKQLEKQLSEFKRVISSQELDEIKVPHSEIIELLTKVFHDGESPNLIKRSENALEAYHKHNEPPPLEGLDEVEDTVLTIFTPLRVYKNSLPLLVRDKTSFSLPLIDMNVMRDSLIVIEQFCGEKSNMSSHVSNEIIKDFQSATQYPQDKQVTPNAEEITQIVHLVALKFGRERSKAQKTEES